MTAVSGDVGRERAPVGSEPREPPEGTAERWAWDYVTSTSLAYKLAPPPVPEVWEESAPRRSVSPGRPASLCRIDKATKTRGLASPLGRARALHTFFHHELQAAELMAWAVLAFPDAPRPFRKGLLHVATDEVRHMGLYAAHIEELGYAVGEFPVRDWFWERVPACRGPASFVATMGLGFEAANLEHARDFAARFRTAGDEAGARVQELVGLEEVAHVRFGAVWFARFTGGLSFERWAAELPAPLSPMLMRGKRLNREARDRGGLPAHFLDELDAWPSPGC